MNNKYITMNWIYIFEILENLNIEQKPLEKNSSSSKITAEWWMLNV